MPIELTIGYISSVELACLNIILSSHVDKIIKCIACIDETTTGPVSPPPR